MAKRRLAVTALLVLAFILSLVINLSDVGHLHSLYWIGRDIQSARVHVRFGVWNFCTQSWATSGAAWVCTTSNRNADRARKTLMAATILLPLALILSLALRFLTVRGLFATFAPLPTVFSAILALTLFASTTLARQTLALSSASGDTVSLGPTTWLVLIIFLLCLCAATSTIWETRFLFYRAPPQNRRVDLTAYPEHIGLMEQTPQLTLPATPNEKIRPSAIVPPTANPDASQDSLSPRQEGPTQTAESSQVDLGNQIVPAIDPFISPAERPRPSARDKLWPVANSASRTSPATSRQTDPAPPVQSPPEKHTTSSTASQAPPNLSIPPSASGSDDLSPPGPVSDERLNTITRLLDRGVSAEEIAVVIRMFDERHLADASSLDHSTSPPPPAYEPARNDRRPART